MRADLHHFDGVLTVHIKSINFKITARFRVKKSKLDVYVNSASSEVGEVPEISVS